ncbi:hypothetical protein I9054_012175 [Acinetobacter bereziniae]|uniref:Uncharacterized protein n=1 Tax=Acinetobacter bereziniae TaxID=106648 RepID=A0A8I1AJ12_ACIBZ|nr:hypothetical protein [Acinetobacter bereziniae]QQC82994.1 hypothetical protein I9190_11755 [Acinetobacter bereziniae]UUN96142.1 hypothetical protein I9054_012175 [Acinetobacter bereziniae]
MRIVRALLALDIPYAEAMKMPLNIAYAFLCDDERLENTRHRKQPESKKTEQPTQLPTATSLSSAGVTYVATKRSHS